MVVVQRSRSLDTSLQFTADASAVFNSFPLSVIQLAVASQYGYSEGTTITDGGELQLKASPGTYPVFTIDWREGWEHGLVTLNTSLGKQQIPYIFMKSARPEIRGIRYIDCEPAAFATATAMAEHPAPKDQAPLHSYPRDWLPQITDMGGEDWVAIKDESFSNQDAASTYKEPASMLARFQEWGRVVSHHAFFVDNNGCKLNAIMAVDVSAVLYKSSDGAHQAYTWRIQENSESGTGWESTSSTLGEESTMKWLETDDCKPPRTFRTAYIRSRLSNVLVFVGVTAPKGEVSDVELQSAAEKWSRFVLARVQADIETEP